MHLGRAAAVLGPPSCILRVRSKRHSARFRCTRIVETVGFGGLLAVLWGFERCDWCVSIVWVDRCCAFRSLNCNLKVARVFLGVSLYAVPFLLRSGCLRGRSCDRNVVRPFRACRFTLHQAANVAHSELFTGRVVDRPFCGVRNGVPNGSGVIAWSKL